MNPSNLRRNNRIRAKSVRVIDSSGESLGIFDLQIALRMAIEKQVDLIEIAPNATPPVCRLEDFGKFKYQYNKHKDAKVKPLKEVTIHVTTGEHDMHTKAAHTAEFLAKGHRVKVTVQFRGREMEHQEIGWTKLHEFEKMVGPFYVEVQPRVNGKNLMVTYYLPASQKISSATKKT